MHEIILLAQFAEKKNNLSHFIYDFRKVENLEIKFQAHFIESKGM